MSTKNKWTKLSIEYANQRSYLDDLFQVYPTIPEGIREINKDVWAEVEKSFKKKDNDLLIRHLLQLDLFPIKDSYIAYLKRDSSAIDRNPRTINRICGRLYEMGLDKIFERCSEPKETNRQIGPMFRDWLKRKSLGIEPVSLDEFLSNDRDAILDAGDNAMMNFAKEHLGYNHDKGLDFVGRFNKQFVIGEAKFLTDFGGHQNAQFNDAISTIQTKGVKAVKIAILDGVLYIEGRNKMYRSITETYKDYNIMSALVLREFLYQI
ncbi:MAG TPA: restriction endonuclease [Bacteroidales bacterium]|nr:restriction endonuclease [Bacteroidales bacterium]